MRLVKHFSKALTPLWKNCCSSSSSHPYAVHITSPSSENLYPFMNSFSLGKTKSHLEPGQRTWSQVSSSTGCHPKCRLWTTPSPTTVSAIRVRIARRVAGWKTRNNNSSTTVSERWRNARPSAFQLQVSMLKSDKIWCAYLVVNCVRLRTFWTPLECHF